MNQTSTIFSQLLQLFPRREFHQVVAETEAERHTRGFTCWGQFVAMLLCQLGLIGLTESEFSLSLEKGIVG